MNHFNGFYHTFRHHQDAVPIIRCSELVGAIAACKGRTKLQHVVAEAFPTIDMRKFPVGEPAFDDLYLTTANAKTLLKGLGPTLKDDPFAVAKLPKIIADLEGIERKARESEAVPA